LVFLKKITHNLINLYLFILTEIQALQKILLIIIPELNHTNMQLAFLKIKNLLELHPLKNCLSILLSERKVIPNMQESLVDCISR